MRELNSSVYYILMITAHRFIILKTYQAVSEKSKLQSSIYLTLLFIFYKTLVCTYIYIELFFFLLRNW